jgi:hypothetical protein
MVTAMDTMTASVSVPDSMLPTLEPYYPDYFDLDPVYVDSTESVSIKGI